MDVLADRAIRELRCGPPLRLAVVFGSVAAGRSRPDSDVDLAILPRDPALSFHDEMLIAARVSRAVGREVDLVRLDRASPLLRWEIARNGMLLVADPWEWARFRAYAASEHADMADSLQRAAKLFRRRLAGINT